MKRPGAGWVGLVLLACVLFMPCITARAGEEADGSEPVIAECPETEGIIIYGTDENGQELTAQTTTMVPDRDEPYVIGNKKATWLVASQSGTYHITGTSQKTLLEIKVGDNDDIRIVFKETYMTATKDCPGMPADARSAIRIVPKKGYTGGGKVKDVEPVFKVLSDEDNAGRHTAVLTLGEGVTSNDALRELLGQGVIVNSFKELIPRMNDIFIKLVTQEEA